jgi:endonuclease-3
MLSAQCTDIRVNKVTPDLFKAFPGLDSLASADPFEIFPYIKSISYPNSKSNHLAGMAKMVMDKFNGKIPSKRDELILLPGVGRKTANVMVSVLHNQPAFAVDTHVFRVSARLGFSPLAKTPLETEKILTDLFPESIIPKAHHWLILHGRYVCKARKPDCMHCNLQSFCLFFQKNK